MFRNILAVLLVAGLMMASGLWAGTSTRAVAPRANGALSAPIPAGAERTPGLDPITVPGMLSYQGKLTDSAGNPVPNGAFPLTFRLYPDSTGGVSFWSEVQQVQTRGGLFNCLLGKVTSITSFPEDGSAYLEMQIDPNPPMMPRIRIASSAYAFLARKADTANYAILGIPTPHNHLGENWTSTTVDRGLLTKLDRNTSGSVYGTVDSAINNNDSGGTYGGLFNAIGSGYGVFANCSTAIAGPLGGSAGVYGGCYQHGNAHGYGGLFDAYGSPYGGHILYGISCAAISSGTGAIGINSYASMPAGCPTGAWGGWFQGESGGSTGTTFGIYATATGGAIQYAGYFDGNFVATGAKNAAVRVGEGDWRLLYCQESPEVWFEDAGEGQLLNGRAHIELDPTFLKTVTISTEHVMKVFVQLDDNCNGVYVQRGLTGFDVIELQSGTSNAHFTYRVMAKRKGYENARLTQMAPGTNPDELRAEAAKREAADGRNRPAK